ncbi:efflux RND transporter periplasmic adaptor subunit [Sandaracinus amylolyticus]|uniref:efflux RND transporter periplasmic adaptor subunit n=1 Tax=Sandaracinus amylolyticus TaxID=927083 RepID=UPI00069D4AD5|nr:efflux RND transporter periplasmic adaptor subunit [Sandaracinus amylolyticus]
MSSNHRRLAAGLVLVALLAGGCGTGERGGGGAPSAAARAPAGPRTVVTARAEPTAWRRTLSLGGTLEAPERVEVAARVEGAIVGLDAELGDVVRRGSTLARITSEDFAARVAQSEAELAQARLDLERAERLAQGDLATRERLEQARTKLSVAEAQRALAGRQLRDTRVIAPFDGAIAQRLVSPGAFVRVGTPLFVLVATSPLRLAIDVPERLGGVVRESTPVTIELDGVTSETAGEAHVARVAPVVDPETRTFRAQVEVAAPEGSVLRPGTYVRATIDLGAVDDAVSVPRPAVFEVLGRSRVVEVVEGRTRPHDVEIVGEGEGVAIVRGLAPGAIVVARSPGLLAPDVEVRAGDEEDAEGAAAARAPDEAAGARSGS